MIFQNNRRISGLENELLKLKSDSKDKEQTINELQNKIESLSIDSDHHYKDLYEISTKENRELNVKIEKLWSELDSLQKLVNQLTIERNKDDIENYLRDQLKLLKQENTRLNSLFNSDIHSQDFLKLSFNKKLSAPQFKDINGHVKIIKNKLKKKRNYQNVQYHSEDRTGQERRNDGYLRILRSQKRQAPEAGFIFDYKIQWFSRLRGS
ncbi:hypothetical protein C2G38_2232929 [Gigaspora rosea]|uniref:Uncharacterized protein n=1 Tax=Gigaspora rosea TaxID=44941 RepID=A0A397TRL6_9GLOM|nr:hypothetical protein C2G38_2232929 [Gigaspora rosea]